MKPKFSNGRIQPERCPYCSFQPTNMNDFCSKHRPKRKVRNPFLEQLKYISSKTDEEV